MKEKIENRIIEYFIEGKIKQSSKDFLLRRIGQVPFEELKEFDKDLPTLIEVCKRVENSKEMKSLETFRKMNDLMGTLLSEDKEEMIRIIEHELKKN